MLCPYCLEPSQKLTEKFKNFNIHRVWECPLCHDIFKTSESHLERPYDFLGENIMGINQKFILTLLFEQEGEMYWHHIRKKFQQWCEIIGKNHRRQSIYEAFDTLHKRGLIKTKGIKVKLAEEFNFHK